ncbi:DHHC zinc finger protein (macronuclear) [Tetrahymena thermophila SB210]|uniref:DHHC zinc finger protein n=1 Tax=Tetrahymena thermophila (strain SB210) TaxID=312017 RepID=W7WZQ9_TETTS|nr:DHHC zinc finger protein [Tetrahymena thermophila SB210]EWS71087.1 DHHC zinc finger protein [Tetrahymena thermophila SB210]|eukprot:XP_012656386.1 DHHC zinc finger protein [Tetrahymena thermophila SB210]
MAQNGLCAEAIENMVIFSNQTFSQLGDLKLLERCAIVQQNKQACIYPRLGYILDIKKGLITKDIFLTFCALYDSEIKDCVEFQSGFIRINSTQYGTFIGYSFINPDQVLPFSNSQNIACSRGFEFKQTRFLKGCLLSQKKSQLMNNQIANCLQMMNDIQCKTCQKGYALRDDKQKCQLVTQNCQEYTQIQNQNVCISCLPYYILFQQSCVFMKGCQVISRKNPKKCMACDNKFELIDGECMSLKSNQIIYTYDFQNENEQSNLDKQSQIDTYRNEKVEEIYFNQNKIHQQFNVQWAECSVIGQNKCLKCNDLSFYYDQKQKKCLQRVRSLYCSNTIYNQDDCLNLECQEDYQINQEIFDRLDLNDKLTIQYIEEYLSHKFFDSDYLMSEFEIQQFYLNYQQKGASIENKVYCIAKQVTQDQNCIQFDSQNKQCLKCQQGYYLINHIELGQPFLRSQCQSNLIVLNLDNCISYDLEKNVCYECQEGYHFNSKTMQCLKNILDCYIHTVQNECLLCQEGYTLNQQNQCNIIFIEQLNNFMIENKLKKQQFNPQCVLFQNEKCILCAEGFVLDLTNNSQCQFDSLFPDCKTIDFLNQDKSEILNMQMYSRDYKVCKECRQGYIIEKGFCIKKSKIPFQNHITDYLNGITNCLMYDDSIICLQCDHGYQFNQKKNQCIKKFKFDRLLFEQQLEPVQNGCLLYSDDGKCKICQDNLFLMTDFNCYEECPKDYFFQYDKQHGIVCFACPLNCQKCTFDYNYIGSYKQVKCLSCITGQIFHSEIYQCKSNCEFLTEEDTNFCVKKCKHNYFQIENKCLKSCPFFYKVVDEENVCIQDCKGMYGYQDDAKKCSKDCDEGYAIMIDQKLCKKCIIDQCKTCNINELDVCIECKIPYTNIQGKCRYQCQNKLIVDNQEKCDKNVTIEYCTKQLYERCQECLNTFELTNDLICACPEGTFFNQKTNECELCGLRCLQCDQKLGCLKCAQTFLKIKLFDKLECTDQCGPGYFQDLHQNMCQRCQKNCLICNDTNNCLECLPTFQLQNNNKKNECTCPLNQTLNEESNTCELQCQDGYKPDTMKCCETQYCSQCNKNSQICDKCNKDFPYLFQNSCRQECPEGYYQDTIEFQCKSCSPLCKLCEKDSSNCLSCSLPQHKIEDSSCKCNKNKVFFQNDCFIECPKYTMLSPDKMVCEEYCTDLSFPVFDELGRFERCEFDLGQPDSKFCYQNLNFLNKLIDFGIGEQKKQQQSESFMLIIQIQKTPKDCYIFKLRGKDENDSFHLIQRLKDQKNQDLLNMNFYLESEIEINQIQENNLVECNTYYCIFYFEVYLKNILQQIYKLRISSEYKTVIVEGIQDFTILLNGEQNVVIPQSIPQEQILQSVMQIQCSPSNYCSQREIKTEINHPVSISIEATFKFGNDEDNLLTIYPLSLYILEKNSLKLPIQTFYFDNSFPSSIKLIVYFNHQAKGQLIIILRAYNQKYFMKGLEFFNYENNYLKFLVQEIGIEVLEAKQNQKEKGDEKQQIDKNIQKTSLNKLNKQIFQILLKIKVHSSSNKCKLN